MDDFCIDCKKRVYPPKGALRFNNPFTESRDPVEYKDGWRCYECEKKYRGGRR